MSNDLHIAPLRENPRVRLMSAFTRIVVKKTKMPRPQNSSKSKLIADFGWQCALRACGKATE
jgi:hypothetical protein